MNVNKLKDELICPNCEKNQMREYHYAWNWRWKCDRCKFECSSKNLKKIYSGKLLVKDLLKNRKENLYFSKVQPKILEFKEFCRISLGIDFSPIDLRTDILIFYLRGIRTNLSKMKPKDLMNIHLVPKKWLKYCGYNYCDEKQKIKHGF